jgi:hypothetical protein
MRIARGVLTLSTFLIGLQACTDHPSTPTAPPPNDAAAGQAAVQPSDPADPLVHAFAKALADPAIRRRVWEDLRDSPFKHHKLHLKSYLRGESGKVILAAGAKATGQSQAELLALLSSLPEMEIAVPIELHRLRWTGTPEVMVVGSALPREEIGRRGTISGYKPTGQPVTAPIFSRVPDPVIALWRTELNFGADPELRRQRTPKGSQANK